ncbi:choloylglycine hydrolase family protein [Oscillospiraceae bacterium MB08-C2-2]|nr:choloylglycine hydrolase family protein [Oscillospiraceae bacterium MB08-C2-2]
MCTAITLQSAGGENVFARTMDFSYDIQPHLYAVPRNFVWNNAPNGRYNRDRYSFMGIGQQLGSLLGFFDGVNEKGFAAASLYFAGYAQYATAGSNSSAIPVASYDFLHYILGSCSSVEELISQLGSVQIVGMPDPVTQTVAPLHWIATDRTGRCVILEPAGDRLLAYNNPIGVLANSPDFPWHMTNLRNYTEASPRQTEEAFWGSVQLTPFGQGGGTDTLPGGYTSPQRFVRTAYLKTHIPQPGNGEKAVLSCFQILKSVSIPKGAVVTARGTDDYTRYTASLNASTGEYYFNTYENPQIRKAHFHADNAASGSLIDLGSLAQPVSFEQM